MGESRCTCCSHSRRADIDAAIVGEEPERAVAHRFKVTRSAVNRHRAHIRARVQRAKADMQSARTLALYIEQQAEEVRRILDRLSEVEDGTNTTATEVLLGKSSGTIDLRLKALDRLHKLAELEFGTKSKVETTTVPPPPKDDGERLAAIEALKRDIAEEEAELRARVGGMQ